MDGPSNERKSWCPLHISCGQLDRWTGKCGLYHIHSRMRYIHKAIYRRTSFRSPVSFPQNINHAMATKPVFTKFEEIAQLLYIYPNCPPMAYFAKEVDQSLISNCHLNFMCGLLVRAVSMCRPYWIQSRYTYEKYITDALYFNNTTIGYLNRFGSNCYLLPLWYVIVRSYTHNHVYYILRHSHQSFCAAYILLIIGNPA